MTAKIIEGEMRISFIPGEGETSPLVVTDMCVAYIEHLPVTDGNGMAWMIVDAGRHTPDGDDVWEVWFRMVPYDATTKL
jgi:hypothetical protein